MNLYCFYLKHLREISHYSHLFMIMFLLLILPCGRILECLVLKPVRLTQVGIIEGIFSDLGYQNKVSNS